MLNLSRVQKNVSASAALREKQRRRCAMGIRVAAMKRSGIEDDHDYSNNYPEYATLLPGYGQIVGWAGFICPPFQGLQAIPAWADKACPPYKIIILSINPRFPGIGGRRGAVVPEEARQIVDTVFLVNLFLRFSE